MRVVLLARQLPIYKRCCTDAVKSHDLLLCRLMYANAISNVICRSTVFRYFQHSKDRLPAPRRDHFGSQKLSHHKRNL